MGNIFNFLGNYGAAMTLYMTSTEKIIVLILVIWSLVWKGLALWRAAHREEKKWFIAILILNTLGILEILYIYVFSKKKEEQKVISNQ